MISLIVAMTENNVIGRGGDMPWRLSNDLRRFKKITMGHYMLMGRKTFDSIGRALPGRTTVVISRSVTYDDPNIRVARSLEQAIALAKEDDEIFVTGGAQIYAMALPLANRLYLTRIHTELDGDTFFPTIEWKEWKLTDEQRNSADAKNDYDHSFLTYERISDNTDA